MLAKQLKSFFGNVVSSAAACMNPAVLSPELLQVEVYRLAAEKQERTPARIAVDSLLEESYIKYVMKKYEAGEKPVSYFEHRINNCGSAMSAVAAVERIKAFNAQLTQRL